MHKPRPPTNLARNLTWLVRFINGETLTKIAEDTKHNRETVSLGVAAAGEVMVEHAQAVLMQEVFPLVTELYREALKQEIGKVKGGKELDWRLVDRLLKGLQIVDRPFPAESKLPTSPGALPEGVDTLTGFIAQRAPARIADKPSSPTTTTDSGEVEDGEIVGSEDKHE